MIKKKYTQLKNSLTGGPKRLPVWLVALIVIGVAWLMGSGFLALVSSAKSLS